MSHRTVLRLPRRVLALIAILGTAVSCADAPGASVATGEEAAVIAAVSGYYEDFSSRDWDLFAARFWEGATLATLWRAPGEEVESVFVSSVPEFVARAPEGPDSRSVFEETMESVEVRVHGDLATAWAHYHARFGEPGDILEWRGVDAFTLLRHGGEWRIVSLAYTDG